MTNLRSHIRRIHRWRNALLLATNLLLFGSVVAHSQENGKALLHLNYLATGGDNWKALAQVEVKGDLKLAGAAGTFRQLIDLKNGRDASTFDAGSIHIKQVNLTDSSWQVERSGVVTYADTPDAKADAINQSFIDRNGWFSASTAQAKYLGPKQDHGQTYQLVSVVPPGGRSLTLWLGTADHLLYRIDQLDASHQLSSLLFSDFRKIKGVLMPYTVRQSNGTSSEDTVQTVRTVRFSSSVSPVSFIPPPSQFRDASLLTERNSVTIPFALADGRVCVSVSIEGRTPLPFLLDSGASNYITPDAAKVLGLTGSGNLPVSGVGESHENGQVTTIKRLRLGPLEMTNQ